MVITMKNILLTALLLITTSVQAEVKLKITPSNPSSNDVIALTFEFNTANNIPPPDFSPLEKDFEILSTAKNSSVSIINNVVKAKTFWRVDVSPKTSGKVIIPSIKIGHEKTKSRTLLIGKIKKTSFDGRKDVFLQTTIDKKTPYVQEAITYTVKLFYKSTLTSGQLIASPQAKNATFKKLGSVLEYQTKVKGQVFNVSEQRYVIFPEKSGDLNISAPIFEGAVRQNQYSQLSLMTLDLTHPIRIKGNSINIKVLKIPSSFPNTHWLPASTFTVSEKWQTDNELKEGEPITRKVTITAKGLSASQLPNLKFTAPSAMKVYTQTPKTRSDLNKGEIKSQKTFVVTYIPSQKGSFTLPKLSIPWWNINTNKIAYSTISSKTFNINASNKIENPPTPPTINITTKTAPSVMKSNRINFIPWLLVGILSLSWLIFFIKNRLQKVKLIQHNTSIKNNTNESKHQLKQACFANSIIATQEALIAEAKTHYKNKTIHHISDIKANAKSLRLKEAISNMERCIYAEKGSFDGKELWQAWLNEKNLKRNKHKEDNFDLPAFNP